MLQRLKQPWRDDVTVLYDGHIGNKSRGWDTKWEYWSVFFLNACCVQNFKLDGGRELE